MKWTKKGLSPIELLISIVLLLVIAFLIIGFSTTSLAKTTGVAGEKIKNLEDCDKDGIVNADDKCPCLSSQGVFSEKNQLWGCPSEIETENMAKESVKKCTVKHCKEIEEKMKEAQDEEKKISKADITISFFEPAENFQDGVYRKDLSQAPEIALPLQAVISNIGDEDAKERIDFSVRVCDTHKRLCFPKKITIQGTRIGVDTVPIEHLKRDTKRSIEFSIVLGKDGDACDGGGGRECVIEAVATSSFKEKEEENNQKEITARLSNQAPQNFIFPPMKTVHLHASADEPGSYPIYQICKGYIGRKDLPDSCSVSLTCQDDFQTDESPGWKFHGCWVVISAEESIRDECGETLVPPGFYINQLQPKQIQREKQVGYYSKDKENDPEKLLSAQFIWKATVEGSLLCSDNAQGGIIRPGFESLSGDNWILCNPLAEGGIAKLQAGGKEFVCHNSLWYER